MNMEIQAALIPKDTKMNKDQQNYLTQQIRQHAQWTRNNVALTLPMAHTETEIAHALDAAGFIINQRPITDVTLPLTAEMLANQTQFKDYSDRINGLLGSYIDDILSGTKDNPAEILSEFVAAIATIEL